MGNDEIIIKSDGVEIARHVRDDRPGRTVDEKHMPQDHKNIKEKNRVYSTTDDVLAITKELDDGLCEYPLPKGRGYSQNTLKEGHLLLSSLKSIQ